MKTALQQKRVRTKPPKFTWENQTIFNVTYTDWDNKRWQFDMVAPGIEDVLPLKTEFMNHYKTVKIEDSGKSVRAFRRRVQQ
jgi:hypothetical protein